MLVMVFSPLYSEECQGDRQVFCIPSISGEPVAPVSRLVLLPLDQLGVANVGVWREQHDFSEKNGCKGVKEPCESWQSFFCEAWKKKPLSEVLCSCCCLRQGFIGPQTASTSAKSHHEDGIQGTHHLISIRTLRRVVVVYEADKQVA